MSAATIVTTAPYLGSTDMVGTKVMGAVLIVIGGIYGLSMIVMLGGGLLWSVSRRFRDEITGQHGKL